MKKYREYMDNVRASDTLHQRLAGLEEPGKRPVPWARYGSMAAALLLAVGLGAWGLGHGGWGALAGHFQPAADPENEVVDRPGTPDIATVDPGDLTGPGEKTLGGYEVLSGGLATYYVLPYIDYGDTDSLVKVTQVAMDWDIPQGAVKRELTGDEIIALMGGEDAVNTHLDWVGYTLTGWAAWYEDGSFWGGYVYGGYPGTGPAPVDHFEFAVTAGQLPPTCLADPDRVTQEIRGLTVDAYGHDGEVGCTRRVSFMKDGYGYRFDLTGTDAGLAEQRVSRLVCRIADQGVTCPDWDGSYTCTDCGQFVPAGEKHSHTFIGAGGQETCPSCGASYPAGAEHECEICTLPLAPDTQTCPDCGVSYPAGEAHYHTQVCPECGEAYQSNHHHTCEAAPGHICGVCGQAVPAGMEHAHGVTCPDCGQEYAVGAAHDCAMPHLCETCGAAYPEGTAHHHTCPTCGESYAAGTSHTCRQGGHHQEGHRGGHH